MGNAFKLVKLLFFDFNFEQADLAINNSKELLFEVFCNIYSSVNIELISKYLDLSHEESEIWIVNLIRKNNIKARFSTDNKNILELKTRHNNAYEETVKKSRDLLTKTNLLINNVTKLISTPGK